MRYFQFFQASVTVKLAAKETEQWQSYTDLLGTALFGISAQLSQILIASDRGFSQCLRNNESMYVAHRQNIGLVQPAMNMLLFSSYTTKFIESILS